MATFHFPNVNNPQPNSLLSSNYFNPDYLFDQMVKVFQFIFTKEMWNNFNNLLILLSLFFITLIAYCAVRMLEIRKKEHAHLHHEIHEYAHHQAAREKKKQDAKGISDNERWVKVLQLLYTGSPGDWKLAVIEADSMLEVLLGQLGFKGETIGDRLKSANPEKFRGLSVAWEVHTIRNRIAHQGEAYQLSSHEAKRVVALYESIFRQYGYI